MILDRLGEPSVITRVLESREPFPAVVGGGDVVVETERCHPAAFADGGRGHG